MQRYLNTSGNSGVTAYKAGSSYIDVQFDGGAIYRYTYSSAGKAEVEEMKRLAAAGKGLASFINRVAKESYAAKLR